MNSQSIQHQNSSFPDEIEVRDLYRQMLDGWNKRNAAPFAEDGESIGFDGSQLKGRQEIVSALQQIFADHPTVPYVSKVKSVSLLSPEGA